MSEWKEYKLGELIETNAKSIGKDYPYSKILYLDTGSITCNSIDSFQEFELEKAPSRAKRLVKQDDIIYSSVRPNQLHYGYITNPQDNLVVSTGFVTITCNKELLCPKFLYYFLIQSQITEYLHSVAEASTSAYPSLKPSDIEALDIEIPPLDIQHRIASILSSLDDKIDLLHRENATLEQMAETMFRQLFVVEAKEEWEEGKLGDLIEVKYGKDHKKLLDGKIPVIGSGGIMRYADTALYNKESVLIPRKGTLNNVMYINEPFWTVDTMFYTEMRRPNIAKFVFHFMKCQDLANMNVGSAVPSMTTEVLNNIPIDIPPQEVFDRFENAVASLYNKKEQNNKQIQTLIQTRDGLLPRLMNNELTI